MQAPGRTAAAPLAYFCSFMCDISAMLLRCTCNLGHQQQLAQSGVGFRQMSLSFSG